MIYGTITAIIFILGFAYVILALANKESGTTKLIGQVLAVLVILIALVVLYKGLAGRGQYGETGKVMMHQKMMR